MSSDGIAVNVSAQQTVSAGLGQVRAIQLLISSVQTVNFSRLAEPKEVVRATSTASRPRAWRTRPIRASLWRASRVYQRFPRYTSNQAEKSMGKGAIGT